ncbi:hypothetical protein E2C01_099482 [Portunus trituberculatus]|uniref:Uncharacterized protein n=1 Tax=Portunus trituberculatus TaxID=210409 RepID=A0A5B7KB33_PORTR|nr:hypothetical protein [Portunus trituberculatus]
MLPTPLPPPSAAAGRTQATPCLFWKIYAARNQTRRPAIIVFTPAIAPDAKDKAALHPINTSPLSSTQRKTRIRSTHCFLFSSRPPVHYRLKEMALRGRVYLLSTWPSYLFPPHLARRCLSLPSLAPRQVERAALLQEDHAGETSGRTWLSEGPVALFV